MCSVRRKISPVWSYFSVTEPNEKKARCDLCGLPMSFRGTISNLKAHLERKHPTLNLKLDSQHQQVSGKQNSCSAVENQNSTESECNKGPGPGRASWFGPNAVEVILDNVNNEPALSKPSTSTQLTQVQKPTLQSSLTSFLPKKFNFKHKKKLDKLLLKLITEDFQPFSIVDDSGFKQFVNALNPSYEIPSRKVISRNYLPAAYEECRNLIKEKLKNITKVCLTTDCWSSACNDSYLALTAHYITEDFRMESVLLD